MNEGKGESRFQSEMELFYSSIVCPAFEDIKAKLSAQGQKAEIHVVHNYASITVNPDTKEEFQFEIFVRISSNWVRPFQKVSFYRGAVRHSSGEAGFRDGGPDCTIEDVTRNEVFDRFFSVLSLHNLTKR